MKVRYEIEAEGETATETVTVDGEVVATSISDRREFGCQTRGKSIEDQLADHPEILEALDDISFLPLNLLQAVDLTD